MKKLIIPLFIALSVVSYSQIKVKVKPLVFKEVRAQNNGIYKPKAKARGVITITTDNFLEDKGKLVKFEVPEYINLVNEKNRRIKTDKIVFRDDDKEVVIDESSKKVIFHVILDKRELSREKNSDLIEGNYEGILPLNYSIYSEVE